MGANRDICTIDKNDICLKIWIICVFLSELGERVRCWARIISGEMGVSKAMANRVEMTCRVTMTIIILLYYYYIIITIIIYIYIYYIHYSTLTNFDFPAKVRPAGYPTDGWLVHCAK